RTGGRIGVYALDVFSRRSFAYRADEAFAMCSTFKWLLAAQLLDAVDRKQLRLDASVRIRQSDILEYAPVVSTQLSRGSMTLRELAEAAMTLSDNSAANLLMRQLGGPVALTSFIRKLGDYTTRLDRIEPELNENVRGDMRDTTTPRGMVTCMQTVLTGRTLLPSSRELLIQWLRACKTGSDRLRAGIPESWHAGDKTGAGANHAFNDVAIAFPPKGGPLLIAVYMSDCTEPLATLSHAHSSIASSIVAKVKQG
ncbi:MAG: class A beta-lactamase, partial [Steroidobacter sp.]